MRIAVISDIHGNDVALQAVLADLERQPADRLVCLGDAVQGGPQPGEVVARLRELACPVVMGNADAWLLTGTETGNESFSAERRRRLEEVRDWSLTRLSPDDRRFIAGFQPTVEILVSESRALLCFHGSPADFDEVILPTTPEDELQRLLGAYPQHYLTGGHTHVQHLRRLGDGFYFNPGTVGLAYRQSRATGQIRIDRSAEYAVLSVDGDRVALEFRQVPLDPGALLAAYRHSGRPYADEAIAQYDA